MQNNPNQEIHTDYRANDIFKPVNANQLANSIHYDFVITQEMLDKYLEKHPSTTDIDVGNLIASDINGNDSSWENPVPAPVSIYIAAKTSLNDPFTFMFGGRLCNGVQPIVDCGSQYNTPKDRIAAGLGDAELYGLGDFVKIHVSGDDLIIGTYDTDHRASSLFLGVTEGVEKAAMGGC